MWHSHGMENGSFGDEAKSQLTSNPENTVFSLFPILGGQSFDEEEVQNHTEAVPYKIFSSNKKAKIDVKVGGDRIESFSTEEIVAVLLSKMKEIAEKYLNEPEQTGHQSATYSQRRAIKDSGKISGFQEVHVVNSHMTATLAYLLLVEVFSPRRVLVIDVGARSLSVAVLSVGNGAIRTLAQDCSTKIGGEIFQQRVIHYMEMLYEKKKGRGLAERLRKSANAQQKLRREVEKAIRTLSFSELADVQTESLLGEDFSEVLMQSRFEQLNMDLFQSVADLAETVLNRAGSRASKLDDMLLIGGSSKIPMLRQFVANAILAVGQPSDMMDPDTSCWRGNLGREPRQQSIRRRTIGAFKPGLLASGNFALVDSTSHCLGYLSKGYYFSTVIPRNEPLPAKREVKVSLPNIYDEEVSKATILVFEGEQRVAEMKNFVDSVQLYFKKTFYPALWSNFTVNHEHTITVSLREMKSNTINTDIFDQRIDQQEIKRMANRLQTFADRDRWEAKRIEARDDLESLAYRMRRQVRAGKQLWTEESSGGRSSVEDWTMAERTAQRVIDWLEEHGAQADAGEFVLKRRELALAGVKAEL
uniref:Heat shock 70 kDa protein 14 n=1 Tax=Macrostomum lignano TaxID=282301 RepID=A0A1I8HSR8_9PLAT